MAAGVEFAGLHVGQPQRQQQLHARGGGKLGGSAPGILNRVACAESAVFAVVEVERPLLVREPGELLLRGLEQRRLLLAAVFVLDLVEQEVRGLGFEHFFAPAVQR